MFYNKTDNMTIYHHDSVIKDTIIKYLGW